MNFININIKERKKRIYTKALFIINILNELYQWISFSKLGQGDLILRNFGKNIFVKQSFDQVIHVSAEWMYINLMSSKLSN